MVIECERAVKGQWFFIAALGTIVFLWAGMESDSYWILRDADYQFEISEILTRALLSESSVLSLPALAALPDAAAALLELRCGAARNAIFRVGRGKYIAGKLVGVIAAAWLSQLLGIILFIALLRVLHGAFSLSSLCALWQMLAARLLASGAFACLGAFLALTTGTASAAIVAPMAICYALKLLAGRFFIGISYIDPGDWLTGDTAALVLSCVLFVAFAVSFILALRREMIRHA